MANENGPTTSSHQPPATGQRLTANRQPPTAFQGEIGAFSEEAVRALFPDAALAPRPSFEAVFEAVEAGEAARAVIPIENSLFGSVHVCYDLLRTHGLTINDELRLRIRHHLMAPAGTALADVRRVLSHPQALGQCADFLKRALPHAERVPVYDTAGAAQMVASGEHPGAAAIASRQAAEEYGLDVLAAGIESDHQNYTRFLVLEREPAPLPGGVPCKTSVVYSLHENVPGALFKSLAVFALRDLDLYKIESRPLIGSPGQYLFYLDLQGTTADEPVQRALDHLAEIAPYLRVLGSYPVGRTVGDGGEK